MSWYNASWLYRVKITVDHTKVNADLSNFPVYVNLADLPAGFHTHVNQTDARDIRVTKSDGTTELAREVVYYDSANDIGELHFLADSLANSSNTEFYIYYGNTGASNYAVTDTYGRNAVWAAYRAVYHLNENPAGTAPQVIDSTGNGNNGTAQNMESGDLVDFALGKGYAFGGTDEFVDLGDPASLQITGAITVSAWVHPDSVGVINDFITRDQNSSNRGWRMGCENDGTGFFYVAVNGTTRVQAQSAITAALHHLVGTYSPSTFVRYYIDGALANENTTSIPASQRLATVGPDIAARDGVIDSSELGDEYRILASALSTEWIATEYNNQISTSTFYSTGPETQYYSLAVDTAALTLTANAVGLKTDRKLNVDTAALSLAAQPVGLKSDRKISVVTASLFLIAQPVGLKTDRKISVDTVSLTLTASGVSLYYGYSLSVDTSSLFLTANPVGLKADRKLSVDTAALSLIAQPVGLKTDKKLSIDTASLTLTANDVDLQYSHGYSITIDTSALTLAAQPVGLTYGRHIIIDTAALSLTSQPVGLKADRKISVDTASLTLSASGVSLYYGYSITIDTAVLSLTANPVALKSDRNLAIDTAVLSLTANSVALKSDRNLAVDTTALSLIAQPIGLSYGRIIIVDTAALSLTANPVSLRAGRKIIFDSALLNLIANNIGLVYHAIPLELLLESEVAWELILQSKVASEIILQSRVG